ncbi:MAG: ribonuclease P protein component [Candidatus Makana argininalis]
MHNFNFNKKFRLIKLKNFYSVHKKPKIYNTIYIKILSKYNKLNYPRIGFLISKKQIKMSYKRNKIKRLIRENFRINKNYLQYIDILLIIKKKISIFKNNDIKTLMNKIWIHFKKRK